MHNRLNCAIGFYNLHRDRIAHSYLLEEFHVELTAASSDSASQLLVAGPMWTKTLKRSETKRLTRP
jgi:hypothetical protein